MKTINLTEHMALVIVGALNVSYGEGITGISSNELTNDEYLYAYNKLIKELTLQFPSILKGYEYIYIE